MRLKVHVLSWLCCAEHPLVPVFVTVAGGAGGGGAAAPKMHPTPPTTARGSGEGVRSFSEGYRETTGFVCTRL